MKQQKIVVFGCQKLAELAAFYFRHDSCYEVSAFTVDEAFIKEPQFLDLPLIPFESVETAYPPDQYGMFVAVGYKGLNATRALKFQQAKEKGYRLASYVCSKSTLWGDTRIGENCFILEDQVIQPFVTVGDNSILWSGSHFGHNVTIGSHCWIGAQVVVSGGVTIGDFTFVGINATIRDNVAIGKKCIIGAGALIMNNAADNSVYVQKKTDLYRLDSDHFERMMGL